MFSEFVESLYVSVRYKSVLLSLFQFIQKANKHNLYYDVLLQQQNRLSQTIINEYVFHMYLLCHMFTHVIVIESHTNTNHYRKHWQTNGNEFPKLVNIETGIRL